MNALYAAFLPEDPGNESFHFFARREDHHIIFRLICWKPLLNKHRLVHSPNFAEDTYSYDGDHEGQYL